MSTENKPETTQAPEAKELSKPKSAKEVIEIFKRNPLPFDEVASGYHLTYPTPLKEDTQKLLDALTEEYNRETHAFYRKYFDLLAERLGDDGVMEIWAKINSPAKEEAVRDASEPSPMERLGETMIKAHELHVKLAKNFEGLKVGDGKATVFETVKEVEDPLKKMSKSELESFMKDVNGENP